MAITSRIAKKYAKGLWLFSEENNTKDAMVQEMHSLVKLITESKDLQHFLKSPIIDSRKKKELVLEIFKNYSPSMVHFILLSIENRREGLLLDFAQAFIQRDLDSKGIINVVITSATMLDKDTINTIIAKSPISSSKVEVINTIDTDIIGGYVLKYSNKQIDASVKTKLKNIRATLTSV